jgi:hypothetical protein
MQKIDAGYIYELGAIIRPLRSLSYGDGGEIWAWQNALMNAHEAIQQFISASIYKEALRTSPHYGGILLQEIGRLLEKIRTPEYADGSKKLTFSDSWPMMQAFDKFEPVMIAELQATSIFFVPPRGGFDTIALIDEGVKLFPESILAKVPETEVDLQQAARCMAFDLPTAAGFHLHRANEAVLRRYFDHEAGASHRPKNPTMGTLLGALKKQQKGDVRIIAALDNIKEFHRNPLMHPEHTLKDVGEAISLYCAIRSAMSYMLEVIPTVAPPAKPTPGLSNVLSALLGPTAEQS